MPKMGYIIQEFIKWFSDLQNIKDTNKTAETTR